MTKVVSKIVDPFIGSPKKRAGEERRRAEEAQAQADASAAAARTQAENLRTNNMQDLSLQNLTNVVAGGGAADAATQTDLIKKKKGGSASLASTLGLTV